MAKDQQLNKNSAELNIDYQKHSQDNNSGIKIKKIKNNNNNNFYNNENEITMCSEEETIMDIIEYLSKNNDFCEDIPSFTDPEFKVNNRFKDFSDEIKSLYGEEYILYGNAYNNLFNLLNDEVKIKIVSNHLKYQSNYILKQNNNNPIDSLNNLIEWLKNLLSKNKKNYNAGAIRFFLISRIIECDVFPNEVK